MSYEARWGRRRGFLRTPRNLVTLWRDGRSWTPAEHAEAYPEDHDSRAFRTFNPHHPVTLAYQAKLAVAEAAPWVGETLRPATAMSAQPWVKRTDARRRGRGSGAANDRK